MATAGNVKQEAIPGADQTAPKLTYVDKGRKTTNPSGIADNMDSAGEKNIARNK